MQGSVNLSFYKAQRYLRVDTFNLNLGLIQHSINLGFTLRNVNLGLIERSINLSLIARNVYLGLTHRYVNLGLIKRSVNFCLIERNVNLGLTQWNGKDTYTSFFHIRSKDTFHSTITITITTTPTTQNYISWNPRNSLLTVCFFCI